MQPAQPRLHHERSGDGVRARLHLVAVLGVVVVGLADVAPAWAGTYEVPACTASVGYVNHSWAAFTSSPTYLEVDSACGETPTTGFSSRVSNLAVGDRLGAGPPPVGVEGGWRITAPDGTSVSAVQGSADFFKDTNNDWEVFVRNAADQLLGGQTCVVELSAGGYCELSGRFQAVGLDTRSVSLGVNCAENSSHNCPDGATLHEVRAELDEATVTISDPVAPTGVTGDVPTGTQHGTVTILGSASDSAAGVASLALVNGGGEVIGGPVVSPGGCNYTYVTPCPTEVSELPIDLDTTKLSNGEDTVYVRATNAAGDTSVSPPYVLAIHNSPPETERVGTTGEPGPRESGAGSGGSTSAPTSPSSVSLVSELTPKLGAVASPVKGRVVHPRRHSRRRHRRRRPHRHAYRRCAHRTCHSRRRAVMHGA